MGLALKHSHTFDETSCCVCGIVFYVPEFWLNKKREDGSSMHCPNGHSLSYSETELDRLRKQLAAKESSLQWQINRAESLDRRLKQEAGKHKALRKRVSAGVCPCCQRTFKQLSAHMRDKHPDYKGDPISS